MPDVSGSGRRPENFIEESRESLAKVVDMRKPWHTRLEVYALVCAVVLGSCIFSMVYPSRHIDDLYYSRCCPRPSLTETRY